MRIGKCSVEFLGQELLNLEGLNRECKFYSIKTVRKSSDCVNHHIMVIDVSESMKDKIEKLKKGIKETLRALKREENNYVSIILYSKNSEILAKAIKCDDLSYRVSKIYKSVDERVYSRENTLISNGLKEAKNLTKYLDDKMVRHNILLFTDGFTSDVDASKEDKKKCFEMTKDFSLEKISINTVGLGSYYDREFLKEISSLSHQGKFNHIGDIKEFYKIVSGEIKRVNSFEEVNLYINNDEYFVVPIFEKRNDPGIIRNLEVNKSNLIVVFDDDLNIEGKIIKASKKILNKNNTEEFSYALARYYAVLDDASNLERAIKISGDKNIYEAVSNCYSFMEKGRAIEILDEAINDTSRRFRLGKIKIKDDENSEPMCLLEVLQEIMNDDSCKLLWDHSHKYNRIGVKQRSIEDSYKFIRPSIGFGEVTSISIGEKKLNIAVKVKIDGAVQNEVSKLKLDACIYREYNLVSNGNINTDEICCILSKNAKSVLRKEKLIKSIIKVYDKEICVLNLKNIKVANKRSSDVIDDKTIAKYLYDIEILKCDIWALEKFLNEIFSDNKKNACLKGLCDEEIKVRQDFRVDENGIYYPVKIVKDNDTDYEFYISKIVDWKVDKFPKTKERNASLEKFKFFISGEMNDSHKRIKMKLVELKKEKVYKQNLVNIVKISSMLKGGNVFLWDSTTKRKKVETDPDIKMNVVVGQNINVSTKEINGVKIREDFYEVIKKFN